MLQWFSENAGDILVIGVLAVIVCFIIVKMVRDKKNGKSSCGCNCAGCGMAGSCHANKRK